MARINIDELMRDLDRSMQEFTIDTDTASIHTPDTDDMPSPQPPPSLAELLKAKEPDAITGYLDYLDASPRDQLNRPIQFQTRFFVLASDGMFLFHSASPSEVLLDHLIVSTTSSFVSHMPPLCFEVGDQANDKLWILLALTKSAKNVWLSKLSAVTRNRADNASDYSDVMGSYLDYDDAVAPEPVSSVPALQRIPTMNQNENQHRISSIRSDRQPEGYYDSWQQPQQQQSSLPTHTLTQSQYRPAAPVYFSNNNNEQQIFQQYRPVAMARILSDQGTDHAYLNYRRNQTAQSDAAQFQQFRKASPAYSSYSPNAENNDSRWNVRSSQESSVPSMGGIPGGGIFGKESPGLELERSQSSPSVNTSTSVKKPMSQTTTGIAGVKRMKSVRGQIAAAYAM
ncbi:hypothetical protein BJ741DRAFT_575122 [Chytriomyces cf. hyalinus JEL632]|nr:hypothetical protein BJ741DRAFT_575122 [Chytriomyces cf. hyalinus JEL632]